MTLVAIQPINWDRRIGTIYRIVSVIQYWVLAFLVNHM